MHCDRFESLSYPEYQFFHAKIDLFQKPDVSLGRASLAQLVRAVDS
jgi:hypothetical protein